MAQRETNYDEAKVPDYALPKILVDQAGSTVTDASQWVNGRRAEILGMFETSVYGKTPRDPVQVEYRLHKSTGTSESATVDFTSTQVPSACRGKGIAEALVRHGLRWAQDQGYHIQASCWYVAKFIRH